MKDINEIFPKFNAFIFTKGNDNFVTNLELSELIKTDEIGLNQYNISNPFSFIISCIHDNIKKGISKE